MVNPHLDNGTPWGGSAPYERPMRPERPPGQPSSGQERGSAFGQFNYEPGQSGYRPNSNLSFKDQVYPGKPHIFNFDRAGPGIMSQLGGYGSDTYNALVGGANRPQQGGGFDRRKWSSALGHPEMAAVDPSDWRTILKILEAGGDPGTETQTAYNPGDYDRPMGMGPGGWDSIGNRYGENYEDLETIPLDMQFDQWGNPIGGDDYGYFGDTFAARGGLMSLRR